MNDALGVMKTLVGVPVSSPIEPPDWNPTASREYAPKRPFLPVFDANGVGQTSPGRARPGGERQ